MIRFYCKLLISLFISGIAIISGAYSQSAKVLLERDSIFVGEQVKLKLRFSFPANTISHQFPVFENDTITSTIEIISSDITDTIISGGKLTELEQTYTITSFDSGIHVLPSLPFAYINPGDTTPVILMSDSVFFNVNLVQVDTTLAIMDIKNPWIIPFQWREYLPYFIAGIILLIIAAMGIYYYMRRRKGLPLFPSRAIPLLPPDEEALAALEKIRKDKIWRSGQLKSYYTVLTDTLRRYIDRRYHIPAPEFTSDETIQALSGTETSKETISQLDHVFRVADMVKFAKSNPDPTENEHCLDLAFEFVQKTKPEIPEKEQSVTVSDNQNSSKSEI